MSSSKRHDGRRADELRPTRFRRRFTRSAPGSVLASAGQTVILTTVSVEPGTPLFLKDTGKGWLTAEYNMLPGSTSPRRPRERGGRVDGRTAEIQRLIGRSLRAVVDLEKLGERTIWVDCDVLQADGGTRTLAITAAFVAVVDAVRAVERQEGVRLPVLRDSVAAVSVGLVGGKHWLDLDYAEDAEADVDLNLVMTGQGRFIEVQGSGEEATFSREELDALVDLGRSGITELTRRQKTALGSVWPLD